MISLRARIASNEGIKPKDVLIIPLNTIRIREKNIKKGINLIEIYCQNSINEYLLQAKSEARAEKGYQSYNEKLITE